jgi:hypothetical protein
MRYQRLFNADELNACRISELPVLECSWEQPGVWARGRQVGGIRLLGHRDHEHRRLWCGTLLNPACIPKTL